MTTQTTNLQLLLADYQINKTFNAKHDLTVNKRFNKIIKAIQRNSSKHLQAVSEGKDKQLLENCLTNLKEAITSTDKLATVTILFALLLTMKSNTSSLIDGLINDVSEHL